MSRTTAREWLAEHPRLIGVLFTMFLLASQAGTAVATHQGYNGP